MRFGQERRAAPPLTTHGFISGKILGLDARRKGARRTGSEDRRVTYTEPNKTPLRRGRNGGRRNGDMLRATTIRTAYFDNMKKNPIAVPPPYFAEFKGVPIGALFRTAATLWRKTTANNAIWATEYNGITASSWARPYEFKGDTQVQVLDRRAGGPARRTKPRGTGRRDSDKLERTFRKMGSLGQPRGLGASIEVDVTNVKKLLDEFKAPITNMSGRVAALETKLAQFEDTTGGLWRMANGVLIQVRQMSDSHLANCIKLIESRPSWRRDFLPKLIAERTRRQEDRKWAEVSKTPTVRDDYDLGPGKLFAAPMGEDGKPGRYTFVGNCSTFKMSPPVDDKTKQRPSGRTTRMLDVAIAAFAEGEKVMICTSREDRDRLWNALNERLATSTVTDWRSTRATFRIWTPRNPKRTIRICVLPKDLAMVEADLDSPIGESILIDHDAAEKALRARFPKLFQQIER